MPSETLLAFIDWENIRKGFKDFVEYIKVEDIIRAFEELGKELGELRGMFFYGDWTRRKWDARAIEDRGYRAINVLSTRFGKDRSDQTMAFAMYDAARERKDITAFIVGSGDADFKEAIVRSRDQGKRIYVLCFGVSASRELFTMTQGVYPLEGRLDLTSRTAAQIPLMVEQPGQEQLSYVVTTLDSLEKALPVVVWNYFRDKILLPTLKAGETADEVENLLAQLVEEGLAQEYSTPTPKMPGRQFRAIRLNRDNLRVQQILGIQSG